MNFLVDGVEYSFSTRIPTNAEKSFQYLLLRLLLGACEFRNRGAKVTQRKDFSVVPPVPQSKSAPGALTTFLGVYSVGRTPAQFIKATIPDNRKFHQDLLAEFANYFSSRTLGAHTTSFVFLYRVLERLYFSVPLLYCSTMQDYAGTFDDLKKLFSDEKAGEHGLFKKFLAQGKLIDTILLDTTYTVSFASNGVNAQRHFDLAKRLFDSYAGEDPTTFSLEIKFRDVPELLRNNRNRFFHLRVGDGQKNISISELHDVEAFFKVVNPIFCSFLASVVLHSIARKYQV